MEGIFGTNNLFYVPEDGRLRLYDLYRWRTLVLNTRSFQVRLRAHAFDDIVRRSQEDLNDALAGEKREGVRDEIIAKLGLFLKDLKVLSGNADQPLFADSWLKPRIAPQLLTLWICVSDVPAESFFEDDYTAEADLGPRPQGTIPMYGMVRADCLGDVSMALPEEGRAAAFGVDANPADAVVIEPIDPRVPLPLLHEYCGTLGVSAHGNSLNYTLESKLAAETSGCVPLHRFGKTGFATLYFHNTAPVKDSVILRVRELKIHLAEKAIAGLGYEQFASSCHSSIWVRPASGDCLHVYIGAPGKESEGVRELPSFVLAAMAGGKTLPAARNALLRELTQAVAP